MPDIGLLFWMTISFLIVFVILAKYGFPVVTKAVDKRNKYIQDSLAAAKEAEEKLCTFDRQAQAILDDAKKEKEAILNQAHEAKNQIIQEAQEKAANEMRMKMERARAEIEASKQKAVNELRVRIADISVQIARKVVEDELSNSQKQQELIDKLLNEKIVQQTGDE